MATNSADRQRAYRQRHLADVDGKGTRINTVIDHKAKLSLERLAAAHGISQRAMLERMIGETEKNLMRGLSGKKQTAYYDKQLSVTA